MDAPARAARSESRRPAAAVRPAGGFRGLHEGEASCAEGSGRDGAAPGRSFLGENRCNRSFGCVSSTPEFAA
jgi:hypothetical protein